jgi:8-oxo-dGTP pyrophosphatase MutT (NUDIX family)
MYKVFFNDRKIILAAESESLALYTKFPSFQYNKKSQLKKIVSDFLNDNGPDNTIILNDSLEELFQDFIEYFKVIEAAGGIVRNPKDQYLLIYRRGKWDLPKGKAEPGETHEETALREVEEETGLGSLKIIKQLPNSFHCYFLKKRPVLKHTFWYEMMYNDSKSPIPQVSEDITDIKWLFVNELDPVLKNTFPSVVEVLSSVGIVTDLK